jgi:hypothetical protein
MLQLNSMSSYTEAASAAQHHHRVGWKRRRFSAAERSHQDRTQHWLGRSLGRHLGCKTILMEMFITSADRFVCLEIKTAMNIKQGLSIQKYRY